MTRNTSISCVYWSITNDYVLNRALIWIIYTPDSSGFSLEEERWPHPVKCSRFSFSKSARLSLLYEVQHWLRPFDVSAPALKYLTSVWTELGRIWKKTSDISYFCCKLPFWKTAYICIFSFVFELSESCTVLISSRHFNEVCLITVLSQPEIKKHVRENINISCITHTVQKVEKHTYEYISRLKRGTYRFLTKGLCGAGSTKQTFKRVLRRISLVRSSKSIFLLVRFEKSHFWRGDVAYVLTRDLARMTHFWDFWEWT